MFNPAQLDLIESNALVSIETKSGDRSYRTTIWAVVEDGEVFVRSVRGEAGRWYQRALANPKVTLHVADTAIPARAVSADDEGSVSRTSAALERKYWTQRSSLARMLLPETLPTTLRLDPA